MNYRVFGHFQWICVDTNILKTMTRKTEKKKIFFACVDRAWEVSKVICVDMVQSLVSSSGAGDMLVKFG